MLLIQICIMKTDIVSRKDIILLVNTFYEKIKSDEMLGFIFNDVAKVNWGKHLPILYDFWENTLFFTGSYSGNPVEKHTQLHHLMPLTKAHFDHWYELFVDTVDSLFQGDKAELAKQRALSISIVLQLKIAQTPKPEQLL
jgi:hemoglobin